MTQRSQPEARARVLDCPRCEVPLSRREVTTAGEGWQVEVDVCVDSCGGVWIDKEDFHVDPSANLVLNKALCALNFPALKGLVPEAEADCPVCKVPMAPYHWKHTDVDLDRCGQCRGLWFDGTEVAAVQTQLRRLSGATSAAPSTAPKRVRWPLVAAGLVALIGGGVALSGVGMPKGKQTPKGVQAVAVVLAKRTEAKSRIVKLKYQVVTSEGPQEHIVEEPVATQAVFDKLKPGGTVLIRYDKADPEAIALESELKR